MTEQYREKILLVDDEENILAGLKRQLRGTFNIETAVGGHNGLQVLQEKGPFAVIVSDISNMEYGVTGTMGNYLSYQLRDQYAILGFLFSQGSFTAVGMEGETYTGLETQTLDTIPKENSLNALMSYTLEPAFFIDLDVLRNYLAWYNAFEDYMEYFHIIPADIQTST